MRLLTCTLTLIFSLVCRAEDLTLLLVGDEAPESHIVRAEDGEPISLEEEEQRLTVLLFWASWSPEAREALAHLVNLHERLGAEELRMIAISTEPRGRVNAYIKLHEGNFGDVEFACDQQRQTFTAYMLSAVEKDVPRAFVIDEEKRIAWIGHPSDGLETALSLMLAEDWSLEQHRRARLILLHARRAALDGERERLIELTHELSLMGPVYASYGVYHVSLLAGDEKRAEEAWQRGRELLERYPKRADVTEALALFVLDTEDLPQRDFELALAAAKQAAESREQPDPRSLYLVARAQAALGRIEEAIEVLKQAREVALEAEDTALAEHLERAIQRYERRLDRRARPTEGE